jgi:hypothetical protein
LTNNFFFGHIILSFGFPHVSGVIGYDVQIAESRQQLPGITFPEPVVADIPQETSTITYFKKTNEPDAKYASGPASIIPRLKISDGFQVRWSGKCNAHNFLCRDI